MQWKIIFGITKHIMNSVAVVFILCIQTRLADVGIMRYNGFGSYPSYGWDPTRVPIDPPDGAFGVVYVHGRT